MFNVGQGSEQELNPYTTSGEVSPVTGSVEQQPMQTSVASELTKTRNAVPKGPPETRNVELHPA